MRASTYLLALLVVAAAGLAGCASCPTSCAELKAAADAHQCPERTITTTVTVFQPLELGELPPPPPLTSATVAPVPVADALAAVAQDLRDSRAWGWVLYHMLAAIKAAAGAPADP